jgi:hypothetical protein
MSSPQDYEATDRCYCRTNASRGSWQAWFMNEEVMNNFL